MTKKTVTKKLLSDGSTLLFSAEAACHMRRFGGTLTLHTCKGVISGEFADEVIADGMQVLAKQGSCVFMVDGWDSSRMTMDFSNKVLPWMKENDDRVEAHILMRSKLADMVISVANLALRRRVETYSSIDGWVAAGKAHYRPFCRHPITLPYAAMADL